MDVALLIPKARSAGVAVIPGAVLLTYETAVDLVVSLRATSNPAVIWSDGLDQDALEAVAAAVRDRQGECIEVRSQGWDGETFSPLSAACRGVISGFGDRGLAAAATIARG